MTLRTLLYEIAERGLSEKVIRSSYGGSDIYELNAIRDIHYPMLFTCPSGNHRVKENTTEYNITLYYLDRLIEDNSNEVEIFSTGIEQLKNLVIAIEDLGGVVEVEREYDMTNFVETEAMNDKVAGAYCTIVVKVINDTTCTID